MTTAEQHSVRPRDSLRDRGGRVVEAGKKVVVASDRSHHSKLEVLKPVFPVDEADGDELLCRPCEEQDEIIANNEEEEQAALPGCLPSVYQLSLIHISEPTRPY